MERSITWRATLGMPANSRDIQSGATLSTVTDALPIDGRMGERKTRGQSSGCSFALHIPCAVPAMIVSSASSKKHPIDCVRLFFLSKFMGYNVVVNIYGCRLVIVLFDGYNIMVRWAVRYV